MVRPAASTRFVARAQGEPRVSHRAGGLQHRALLVEDRQRPGQLVEVVAQPVRLKCPADIGHNVSEPGQQQGKGLLSRLLEYQDLRLLPIAPSRALAKHLSHPGMRILQIGPGIARGLNHPADVEDVILVQSIGQIGVLDRGQRDRRRRLLLGHVHGRLFNVTAVPSRVLNGFPSVPSTVPNATCSVITSSGRKPALRATANTKSK